MGPLNPRLLAKSLNVRIWKPSEVPGVPASALRQLTVVDARGWAAVTIVVGGKSLIIVNDKDSKERQNNSLAHELSHLILKHKPAQVFVSKTGQMMLNHYDPVQEEEATCLSGTLLVPRDSLLSVLSGGFSREQAAAHFVVTTDLLQMRVNKTGVERQLSSRRRYRSR